MFGRQTQSKSCLLSGTFIASSILSFPGIVEAAAMSPSGHGASGVTWLNWPSAEDPRTGLLFIIANFLVLLWILNKILFKGLRDSNAKKSDTIREQLDKATAAREEAEAQLQSCNAKLEALDTEIKEIRESAKNSAEAERKRILEQAEQDAEKIKSGARKSAERDSARKRAALEAEIVERALADAEKRIRSHFNDGDQARIFDSYLNEIAKAPLRSGAGQEGRA